MSSIDGMPIQYLNGIDDDLDGLLGLDGSEADDQKLYDHLVNTRNNLAANPSLVKSINPASMLEMLNYAIRYWNTDKRNLALQILDNEEERLIKAKATLKGVDKSNQPLDGFFKKIFRKVGDKIKDATIAVVPGSAKAFAAAKAITSKKTTSKPSTTPIAPQNTQEQPQTVTSTNIQTTPQNTQNQTTSTITNTQNKMPDAMQNPNPGFVEKYLTPKNLIIGGVLLTAAFFGYKMLIKKDQPRTIAPAAHPALSGVHRRRGKTAKRKPTSVAKPKARKAHARKVRTVKVR